MMIETHRGAITSVESWFEFAPPKGREKQWVDGFSAKELAKAWCRGSTPAAPAEFLALFDKHPDFEGVEIVSGEPEARVRFDNFGGEPRNADLILRATDAYGPLAISVEAKGHEDFGSYLGEAAAAALEARIENPRSNALARLEQLSAALLPPRGRERPHARMIRYQLLTGIAGALAWAELSKCRRAVFVIHEFLTPVTDHARQEENARDLAAFLSRTAGIQNERPAPFLYGPISVPGAPLFANPPQLYIGKVRTDARVPVV